MDVLANTSLESFKILVWAVALVVGGLWFYISAHKRYWEIIASSLLSLLAASTVFLLANLGVAFYILSRATDPRWSAGREPIWTPDKLESNLPFINDVVNLLNGVQENVSGAVNNVGAVQNALFATGDFLWMVVLSIPVIIVLAIASFIVSKWAKKRYDKQQAGERAEEIRKINNELDNIKRHVGMIKPDMP
jgi:hypothetical protein